jgi:cell division FtsZ-interacting protein ZapD
MTMEDKVRTYLLLEELQEALKRYPEAINRIATEKMIRNIRTVLNLELVANGKTPI